MLSGTDPSSSKSAISLQELIEEAHAGSSDARGRAIQTCWNYLIAVARQEMAADLQPRAGASDMVQESFLHAHRAFNKFRGRDQSQLQAWIRKILLYRISRFRRGQRSLIRNPQREIRLDDSRNVVVAVDNSSEFSSCTKLIREEQIARLRLAINALKPQYRELIVLRGLQQLSIEEIAERQGRTPAAVSRAWLRAVERLCQEYNRLGGAAGAGQSSL